MKDVLDLKESLEDARIFQDFGIEPAFSIYDGGGFKKLMEISSIREKYLGTIYVLATKNRQIRKFLDFK